jgi:hypothetical protein
MYLLNWPFHPPWLTGKTVAFLVKISQRSLHHPFHISGRRDLHENLASFYDGGRLLEAVIALDRPFHPLWLSSKAEAFLVKISQGIFFIHSCSLEALV